MLSQLSELKMLTDEGTFGAPEEKETYAYTDGQSIVNNRRLQESGGDIGYDQQCTCHTTEAIDPVTNAVRSDQICTAGGSTLESPLLGG